MAPGLPRVLERLRLAGDDVTDGELLARFAATRDEAAFAALLRRHGPMVLGVCRRVLHHAQNAEDAFQATFLILAQKSASVRKRDSVGCWLHGVAYRTALAAAAVNARRRVKERQVREMPQPEVAPAEVPDWRPLLDRELSRLSKRYRAAVVLCDLEGKPRQEAARLLGVPESTLANRLARARTLLAKRLRGRGKELTGAALAAALAEETVAGVPVELARATARAAAGRLTAASVPAVLLKNGVMQAMLLRKLKLVVLAILVTAALGAAGLAYRPGYEARAQNAAAATRGADARRPAQADQPEKKVARQRPHSAAPLREALNLDLKIPESVQMTLPMALIFLEDQAREQGKHLAILINSKAVQRANEGAGDVETAQVKLTKRDQALPLRVLLQEILDQYQSTSPAGRLVFAVVGKWVMVGPPAALQEAVRNQPVSVDTEGVPLRQVLRQLSDRTGTNLVLDARVKEEPKVTLAVADMALHTAVHLLAEMADLRAVELPEGGYFLTTAERADRLRKQQKEGLFPAEKPAPQPEVWVG